MSILRRLAAFSCAFSPLLVGCIQGEPIQGEDVAEVSLADKNGSTGLNGMSWADYQLAEEDLVTATAGALVDDNTQDVTQAVEDSLLSTPEGVAIFKYAVECAVPAGVKVISSAGSFEGKGHMLASEDWLKGGLALAELQDLLACMMAHVNPYGEEVPLLLSGAEIADDKGDHSEYTVDEALWVVRRTALGRIEHYVWPLDPLISKCGPNPLNALRHRLCGQSPVDCDFAMGDFADCSEDADGYICLGQPALMATLKYKGFEAMYPSCYN